MLSGYIDRIECKLEHTEVSWDVERTFQTILIGVQWGLPEKSISSYIFDSAYNEHMRVHRFHDQDLIDDLSIQSLFVERVAEERANNAFDEHL